MFHVQPLHRKEIMKKTAIAAALALSLGASLAHAQASDPRGWYAGIDVGASRSNRSGLNDDKDVSLGINVGYRLHRNFAVEAGRSATRARASPATAAPMMPTAVSSASARTTTSTVSGSSKPAGIITPRSVVPKPAKARSTPTASASATVSRNTPAISFLPRRHVSWAGRPSFPNYPGRLARFTDVAAFFFEP